MKLDGRFSVRAARDEVYAFLTDPRRVSRYMPDVQEVEIEDSDHFTVKARVGISHIKGTMVMKLAIKDRQPPFSTTVVGTGRGLASVVDMVTSFTLEASESGETVVNWQGELTIAGKLAAFGPQGLLDRMARKNVETFIEGIRGDCRWSVSNSREVAKSEKLSRKLQRSWFREAAGSSLELTFSDFVPTFQVCHFRPSYFSSWMLSTGRGAGRAWRYA